MQRKKVQLGSEKPGEKTQVGFRKYVQVLAGNTDMYANGRKATYNVQGLVAGRLELELMRNFTKKAVRAWLCRSSSK